jgi:hypothetical protein
MFTNARQVAHIEEWVNWLIGRPIAWTLYGLGLVAWLGWEALRRGLARFSHPDKAPNPKQQR